MNPLHLINMNYIEIPDFTLQMLIEAGVIKANTKVYAKDNNVSGIINLDGSITLEVNGKTQNFPYPSGAARAIVQKSVNGWIFWRIKESGDFKTLSEIKKEYLQNKE